MQFQVNTPEGPFTALLKMSRCPCCNAANGAADAACIRTALHQNFTLLLQSICTLLVHFQAAFVVVVIPCSGAAATPSTDIVTAW
jgi:hypothetical protein